jgi:glycosyltransferase involved in cell wall biosynthesis
MRVLHFAESFSPTSETFIYDYVTELERQGADNHVVTYRRVNEKERPFPKVHVVDRPHRWHPRRLWHRALVPFGIGEPRTTDWPQTRERLASVVNQVGPDVVHAHFGPAGVMMAPVAERREIPLVVTFYGYDISSLPEELFWREAYDGLWPRAEAVTVLSNEMKQAARDLGCLSEKLHVVHLSRDLDQFPYRPPGPPVESVLFVGRLVPKKAPLDAVQAVEHANEQGANLHLDLVGDGPLREDVERFVHGQDLADTVTVHGRVPNAEVNERMQATDVFLLPSKTAPNGDREGTPTVLVEAQAVGLPCVSTRHAGIPEMIPEANHDLLTDEGDVAGLADRLVRLASRPPESLTQVAERGRKKVECEFSVSSQVAALHKLYRTSFKAPVAHG